MAPSATESNSSSFVYPTVHSIPTSQDFYLNNPSADDVEIPSHLLGARRKLRVVVLGCGLSGINFFKFAEDKAQNIDIQCYEKNEDIGGTWLENRYPGCACDIPSVVYQFPWRPAPWSKYYSYSPEIWKYVKMVAEENDFIRKYVKLSHEVSSMSWDEETGQWTLAVTDLKSGRQFSDHCDYVINATGVLNKWKWPDIEGLNSFKGTLLHSAQWNQAVDLKGKRVALVGAGSSAVQILPNIYDDVEKVYTWVRSKIWITAGFAQKFAGEDGANFSYTEEQQKLFEDSDQYKAYCKMIEGELNQRFSFIINGSRPQRDAVDFSINEMKTKLSNKPELLEKVMPDNFFVGCRRPTPGNGYLEALASEKTIAFTSQLQRITEKGFIDPSGVEQEVDVIICATGFDTSYKPRLPIIVGGTNMTEKYASEPNIPSYLSVGYPGVPNYMIFAGPYCPAAHGSFFPLIQAYSDYALEVIAKLQTDDIKSIRPKEDVTRQFLRHADTFLKRTAWTGPCSSWFKGGKSDGKPSIWPGSRLHFLRLMEKVRFEDYEIEYLDKGNMWGFLGNGFHVCERDGSDITWYLGRPEKKVDEKEILVIMDGTKGIKLSKC